VVAEQHGLRLLQPEKLNDPEVLANLGAARPDVIAVAAFGQFLPRGLRELPPLGCVNLHASLLPKYRGAAPIAWALIRGETETGVTIMRITEGMDAGPVLLRRAIPIAPDDDAGTLHDRLAGLGASALAEALGMLARGEAVWTPQDDGQATLAPKLRDEDCRLELAGDPVSLVNRIRGLAPAPGAYLLWGGQRLKVLRGEADRRGGPGTILGIKARGCVWNRARIAGSPRGPAGGKRRMTGAEFARGQRLEAGGRVA
jgi:methionyl-tRNA formyltransferase